MVVVFVLAVGGAGLFLIFKNIFIYIFLHSCDQVMVIWGFQLAKKKKKKWEKKWLLVVRVNFSQGVLDLGMVVLG